MNAWNTMDGHVEMRGSDNPSDWIYVLHYSRFRTLNSRDPDYKRQLGFRNPPDDTVVTWNTSYLPLKGNGDPDFETDRGDLFVLFLNGTVKKFSMKQVRAQANKYSWPKPNEFWRLRPY